MNQKMIALGVAGLLVSMVSTMSAAGGTVLFDQIGDEPFDPQALSSSQFAPGDPEGAVTTVDNFSLFGTIDGEPLRLTRIEAAVAGFNGFVGFEFVESWTIQIYSSLEASYQTLTGDIFSASFDAPDNLTSGFASFFGTPVELASFDVDTIIAPGDYYMTVAMENDGQTNGFMGIAGGTIGDGPAWFSGPGLGEAVPLGRPAGYRIIGEAVPAPGGALVFGALLLGLRRRRP